MNVVNLIGRLTKEIELRRTDSGKAVASYSLAVKRPRVADTTDFIELVTWEQGAEYLAKYAHKGDIVGATGTLQPRKWTDKEGKQRTSWEVVTTSVELLSSKKKNEESGNTTQPQNSYPGGYGGAPQGYSQPQYNQQGFGGYSQGGYQSPGYQAPHPQQGSFAPIEGDDAQLPF